MTDYVNHPPHYNSGNIECIDAIEESMTPEAFKGYLKGNIEKYMWRYENKKGLQDVLKAEWYLDWNLTNFLAASVSHGAKPTPKLRLASQVCVAAWSHGSLSR